MPRKLRVEYEGAIYHATKRGDRREPIFLGATDRVMFLQTLGDACQKTGWHVHALCLMSNLHRVVETPRAADNSEGLTVGGEKHTISCL